MKFLGYIFPYSSRNNKTTELRRWIIMYRNTLFQTEDDFFSFTQRIKDKVKELNERYPRSKTLVVQMLGINQDVQIEIYPEGEPDSTVCCLVFTQVKHIYPCLL